MSVTETAKARLVRGDGSVQVDPGMVDLDAALSQPPPFWLDLPDLSQDQADWLGRALGIHPLVIEDAQQFGELPKVEVFNDYIAVVLYGPGRDASLAQSAPPGTAASSPVDLSSVDALGELHCIVSTRYIVTVHRGRSAAVEQAAAEQALAEGPAAVFYRIADALTDGFFPVFGRLDDRLDALQGQVLRAPSSGQLNELGTYRLMLTPLHKVLPPQTDLFASLSEGKVRVPGAGDDQLPYLRDIYDHLRKLSGLADSYRDLIGATVNSYVSVVSNQQNAVTKQLTVIATVFLPLSFLTGFFGQNFSALTSSIGGWPAFLGLGIGTEVVAVALLYLLFWRRGWLRP